MCESLHVAVKMYINYSFLHLFLFMGFAILISLLQLHYDNSDHVGSFVFFNNEDKDLFKCRVESRWAGRALTSHVTLNGGR